jgi:hypothetical protein
VLLQGSLGERITSFFIGGAPCLKVEEVVYSAGDRFRLQTVSGGVVHIQLGESINCTKMVIPPASSPVPASQPLCVRRPRSSPFAVMPAAAHQT